MKTSPKTTALSCIAITGKITAFLLIASTAFAATSILDLNGTSPGFYDGSLSTADITTTATWTTDNTGVATPVILPAANTIFIGTNLSDFDGGNITVNMTLANNLTGAGFFVVSTNVIVTMAGTANCRWNNAFTWSVATNSTLIVTDTGNNNGFNFNSRAATFAGGGTIDFISAFCANGNALNTMNMPGGKIILEQTRTSNFGNAAGGAFTLTAGALQFASASAMSATFSNFNNGNVFTVGTGNPTIDNTSGSEGTVNMGTSGKFTFGGDFTFIGSSSMSLGNAGVNLTGTRSITVGANTLTIGGTISNSSAGFGLTKLGNGTLMLGGSNTYSGNTTIISAGTLALTNVGSLSSSPLIVSNATFDMTGLTVPATTMTSLGISNSTLVIAELDPALTNILANTLNVGGTTNIVNFSALPLVAGYPTVFHVIKGNTLNGTLNFGLGTLPVTPAFTAYLTNIAASGSVDLVVTAGPVPLKKLKWGGLNGGSPDGTWDIGTTPTWLDASSTPTTYGQNDFVTFNDAATGQTSVNLTTTLTPTSLTVSNNTLPYTLGGNGKISGTTGLLKQGSGTLILDETGGNDFGGVVNISNGTLQVGNNDGGGNLPPTSSVVDNAALVFNRNDIPNVANVISGTGTLTQNGAGTLVLSGANTFTGAVSVLQGTLQAANNSALGTTNGGTTIANGATLELIANAINLGQERIIISGSGVGGSGALVNNSGSLTFVGPNAARVILAGDTTVGGSGRFDLRSATTSDPTLASLSTGGLPRKLTKVGAGTFGFIGITVDPALGDIEVQQGIFSTEAAMTGLGNAARNLIVWPGATLQMFAITNQLNKVITLGGDGAANSVSATSGTGNTIIGPMNITNDCLFNVASGVALTLNNVITGPGKITKVGVGQLTVSGNSPAYAGGFLLNNGSLTINGTLGNTVGTTVVAGKLTLNGTLLGGTGLTNTAASTIAGSGTNMGPADISGILNPGDTNVVGTLTVSNLVLESGASLNYDLGSTTTPGGSVNDLIIVNGDLTINANAITINPLGLLLVGAGNPYRLFNYTGSLIWNGDLTVTGPNNYTYTVDTNTPGQVNIVASGGPPIWNGGSATTSNWSDAANWNGVAINSGDSLFFNGPSRLSNVNDTPADTSYTDLNFVSGASAFVLNGNPIALGGNVINNSSNPQALNLALDFSGPRTLNGATAPLIIGGGVTNTANLTTLTLAGNGTLTNLLGATDPASMTNILAVSSNANWTLMDNASSTPITTPVQLDILAGTLNFGQGANAPNLISTASANNSRIGVTANAPATLNMINGTLTISSRLNTGAAGNSVAVLNLSGGTINLRDLFQSSDGSSLAATTINVTGGTLNIANAAGGPVNFFLASRGTGVVTVASSGVINCATLDVSRNASTTGSGSVGVVNLNSGGLLTVSRVGAATGATQNIGTPTATFNFNGGTLKANASSATFYQGNASAPAIPITSIVKTGGAIIDTTNFNISILEPLRHDGTLGATADGGLTKFGTGTLTLTAVNTYTGPTVVNAGTLTVNGVVGTNTVTVAANATLSGTGTAGTNVIVNAGGTLSPAGANAIGTLTVAGSVTLQAGSTNFMELNKTSTTSDQIRVTAAAATTINYGGTLSLTNLAGSLTASDTFKLFNATNYSGAFSAITPAVPAPGLGWNTNTLATDGILRLVATVNTTPTNITATVSGNQLTLSWPADHTGWRLQVQTNSINTGIASNWVDVAGSTTVNSVNVTIDPANGTVFYRMVYP